MCDGANVKNLEAQRPDMPCPLQAQGLRVLCPRGSIAARLRSAAPAGTPALICCGASSRASHGVYPLQLAVEPPEEDHIQP